MLTLFQQCHRLLPLQRSMIQFLPNLVRKNYKLNTPKRKYRRDKGHFDNCFVHAWGLFQHIVCLSQVYNFNLTLCDARQEMRWCQFIRMRLVGADWFQAAMLFDNQLRVIMEQPNQDKTDRSNTICLGLYKTIFSLVFSVWYRVLGFTAIYVLSIHGAP